MFLIKHKERGLLGGIVVLYNDHKGAEMGTGTLTMLLGQQGAAIEKGTDIYYIFERVCVYVRIPVFPSPGACPPAGGQTYTQTDLVQSYCGKRGLGLSSLPGAACILNPSSSAPPFQNSGLNKEKQILF